MAVTPYDHPPLGPFLMRMAGPALAVFGLGFVIMGGVAMSPSVRYAGVSPQRGILSTTPGQTAQAPLQVVAITGGPLENARGHWKSVLEAWADHPSYCWSGTAVNDFQRQQCGEKWTRLAVWSAVAAVPFIGCAAFLAILFDALRSRFLRARKAILGGKAAFAGTVTRPAEAPNDLFGWFHCLRAIGVQLPNQQQTTVYVPLDMPVPLPGQTLAVFDVGVSFGVRRHVAVLYAPHVAIVAGS